jgi:O-methyltransferase
MVCLDHFWDRVMPGGIVLIDDYYIWEGCRRAVHDFLSRRDATEAIHRARTGYFAHIVKGAL